jgi:hypothetical protein
MITYKLFNNEFGQLINVIKIKDNNKSYIPLDEANTDYQEYLEWIAEGNTPEEAD